MCYIEFRTKPCTGQLMLEQSIKCPHTNGIRGWPGDTDQVGVTIPWGAQDVFTSTEHPLDGLHSTAMHSRTQTCLAKALWPLRPQCVMCDIILVACLIPKVEESRLPYSIPHTYSFILPTFLSVTHVSGRHTTQEEMVTAPVKQPRQGTQEPTTAFPLTPNHHVNHHEGCHTASTQRHTVYLATT